MGLFQIGCLPVVEHDKLIGIVTESDLLHLVERLPDPLPNLMGTP